MSQIVGQEGKVCVVQVTFPSEQDAHRVSGELLNRRWVACAQHHPQVTSMFYWHGNVEQEVECLVTYKTNLARVHDVMTHIQQHHPYDTPECVYWLIEGGLSNYVHWVNETVSLATME